METYISAKVAGKRLYDTEELLGLNIRHEHVILSPITIVTTLSAYMTLDLNHMRKQNLKVTKKEKLGKVPGSPMATPVVLSSKTLQGNIIEGDDNKYHKNKKPRKKETS